MSFRFIGGLAAWAACAAAVAQPVAAGTTLDAVVVTATRTPQKVSDLVAEVSVLDRVAIERSEGRTLVELLSQAPGLQFSANGGLGKSSTLFVRGLEARHVLLLVDGVRVGSATLNSPSLDNLPLEAIERIEIVRGPMSSLYGSNAMGGVVQVFTRHGGPGLRGNARIAAGSRGYALASGGVAIGGESFDVAAQVQRQQTDGFSATNPAAPFGNHNADDDGFRQNAASLRTRWRFVPGWQADALLLESRGRTQYDDGPGADARAGLRNSVQSLQIGGQPMPGWRSQVAIGRSLDRYDTQASASAFTSLGAIETDQRQFAWENRVALPLGEALVVAERIEQDVSRPGTPFDRSDRTINALALGWAASAGAHDAQASLRHDRNSQFGGQTTGALAYAHALDESWRIGGSLGSSFTAPSFNQLYYPGFGNPDLQPEDGRHGELFAQWAGSGQRVRATAYTHRYDLFITSGPQPANVPKVKVDGLTLAWDGRFDALALTASFDHVDPRNRSAGTAQYGRWLPRRARQALKVGAEATLGAWQLGAALQAYGHRFDDSANTVRLGGYGVLDLHADWSLADDWTLGLRLNNAGGKRYETALGYNQPGREGFVTLRWSPR